MLGRTVGGSGLGPDVSVVDLCSTAGKNFPIISVMAALGWELIDSNSTSSSES